MKTARSQTSKEGEVCVCAAEERAGPSQSPDMAGEKGMESHGDETQ